MNESTAIARGDRDPDPDLDGDFEEGDLEDDRCNPPDRRL